MMQSIHELSAILTACGRDKMNDNSRAVLEYIGFLVRQKLDSIPTPVLIDAGYSDMGLRRSNSTVFASPRSQIMEIPKEEVLSDVSGSSDIFVKASEVSNESPSGVMTAVIESSSESNTDISSASIGSLDGEDRVFTSYPSFSLPVGSPHELRESESNIRQIKSRTFNEYGPQRSHSSQNRFIFKTIAVSAFLHLGIFLWMSDSRSDQKATPTVVAQNQNSCSENNSNIIQTYISKVGLNVDRMSPCDIKKELDSIKLLAKEMALKKISVSKPCVSIWLEAQRKSKQCPNRAETI